MGREGKIEEKKIKEGKMEELKLPEWLKEIKGKLTEDNGLYQGTEKISILSNSEQLLITEEGLKELTERALQKGLEYKMLQGWIDKAEEAQKYAKENGIELNIEEALQKGFEKQLVNGWIDKAKEAQKYAKENGIELNIEEALQKALSSRRVNTKEIQEYAEENGIELEVKKSPQVEEKERKAINEKEALQRKLEREIRQSGWDIADNIKKVQEYAQEKGIELDIKEALQKRFEKLMTIWGDAELIQEYAEENGIELDIKEEIIQKAFELNLSLGQIDKAKKIREDAKENGIELILSKGVRNIFEECYIRFVHNTETAHAEQHRNKFIDKAKEEGVDIDYNKVVKMDYLDFLNVPEKERFRQEKEVKLGKASIKSKFYAENESKFMRGKFILAENPETKKVEFIFDATLGEHKDIGNKYDVDVIGGGWLEINQEDKIVTIEKDSADFGYEPRMISATIIVENFPGYEVNVKK